MKKIILLFFYTLFIHTYSIAQVISFDKNLNVERLSNNIYVFEETERYRVNLVALSGSDGIILLDSGFKIYEDELFDTLKSLNSGKVEFIINSHIDRDHVEANSIFGTDVTTIGHKNCDYFFKKNGTKTIFVDESYSFKFNGLNIHITAYPGGHTSCDIAVHIPELNVTYLGDIYFSESFPRVDIESGSKAQVLLDHLKKIHSSLPKETKIIPGHGRVTTLDEFEIYINMVGTTMQMIMDEKDKGKNLEEIQDSNILEEWSEWGTFFSFINRNSWISNIYLSYSGH